MRQQDLVLALVCLSLLTTSCGVVSIQDICLVDPSKCPASTATTTQYPAPSAATLSISDGPTYDFGSVVYEEPALFHIESAAASATKTFTVTNTGEKTATFDSNVFSNEGLNLSGTFSYVAGGTCANSGTVASAASCTFIVKFLPSSVNDFTGTLQLSYNNGVADGQTATRAIKGRGYAPGQLYIAGPLYPGGCGLELQLSSPHLLSTSALPVTVENQGAGSATIGALTTVGLNLTPGLVDYVPTDGDCANKTVLAYQSCTLNLTTLNTCDVYTNTLELNYNNGAEDKTVSVAIDFTGGC